jgi:phosphoribosylanthranilate isomerase
MLWIKICANTNLADALLAAELGVDAVGFVFAPSKRLVTAAQVAEIAPHLPASVERVGVFMESGVDAIAKAVEQAGLTAVQLHGGIDLGLSRRVAARLGPAIRIIHTAHWTVGAPDQGHIAQGMAELAKEMPGSRLLVDSKVGIATGGTGVSFDWKQARSVLESLENQESQLALKIIVAGGLDAENVAGAIRELKPYGVDVASGVESEPGRKDPVRLKRFIEAARSAASDLPPLRGV